MSLQVCTLYPRSKVLYAVTVTCNSNSNPRPGVIRTQCAMAVTKALDLCFKMSASVNPTGRAHGDHTRQSIHQCQCHMLQMEPSNARTVGFTSALKFVRPSHARHHCAFAALRTCCGNAATDKRLLPTAKPAFYSAGSSACSWDPNAAAD
jgi:hypothetical protein